MKTPKLRIHFASALALALVFFASNAFAAMDAYLVIKSSKGKEMRVPISSDGSFTTPALAAGTYQWSIVCKPSSSIPALDASSKDAARGISSPTGGSSDRESSTPSVSEVTVTKSGASADRESSAPSVSEIVVTKATCTYEVKAPRDIATGQASGRRMHKPIVVTKELDKSSPNLITCPLDDLVIDADCDGISGTVQFKTRSGKTIAVDDWSAPTK